MYYIRICDGLSSRGKLIPYTESVIENTSRDRDWYRSLFLYNQEQFDDFSKTGSVAGVTDVVTNRLYIDLDSTTNITDTKIDALKVVDRLHNEYNIPYEDLEICFSGKKGFSVEATLDKMYDVASYRNLYSNLTQGLTTADTVVVNPSRIVRVMLTKHNDTGLFKYPLSIDRASQLTITEIKKLADSLGTLEPREKFRWSTITLPESLIVSTTAKPSPKTVASYNGELDFSLLDYSKRPKFIDPVRWALQNGYFQEGERSHALLCLAATYKNFGYDLEHTYRFLKGVCELQSRLTDMDRFPDEQLYNNIVMQAYGPNWKGGQYSLHDKNSWLYQYADKYGLLSRVEQDEKTKPRTLVDVTSGFKDYVKNIEKNTIKTGIASLDDALFISTGSNVGVIGSAGSGKTALSLNILENTSRAGIKSCFASLDMAKTRLYEKVMYRLTGHNRESLYNIFKEDKEAPLVKELHEKYGNTFFFDKSHPTVDDIRNYILDCEQTSGEKIKLVMIDYFERLNSDRQDDTSASKEVAGQIQDLVNDLDVACITLVQPNKNSLQGDASNAITSYTSIKGSSFLYQSFRSIVSIWRPFYNLRDFTNDKYMSMGILKNDLGELAQLDFKWDGKRGNISELEDYERRELEDLLRIKDEESAINTGFKSRLKGSI